jgi:hypothetical protein
LEDAQFDSDTRITLARGARQLVVQLALDTMSMLDLYSFSFTPTTNIGASLLGAEMTTFLAPPFYNQQFSFLVQCKIRKLNPLFD